MRQTFFYILILVSTFGYSQEFYDSDMKREKPNLKNYYLKTTVLIDSTNQIPFTSLIEIYDQKGRHKVQYELNRQGDTIETIESTYPDKWTEIEVHSYVKEKSDTAIFHYNKRNLQTVEIWKWGEDSTIDTTKFFYDKKDRLITSADIYDFGSAIDSLFYQKNRLSYSKSYETNQRERDSVIYIYDRIGFVELKKYDKNNVLKSEYEIEIGKFKNPKRIVNSYKTFASKEFDRKTITEIEYFNKTTLKCKKIYWFSNGKLEKITEKFYSKKGFLERNIVKDGNGKTTYENKITLHNKELR
ncbi:hypothetical protein [Zunongwangia sp. HRR-M8]|uniref:hypothetical protein n=1 Tax=Zunongwangia sp. HRR-M8 TaxID=3015170 RepID=UPI0022DE1A3B|nr:hypothetical protein [Zunongwangia sp. HRR-M8]WBL23804.1 hypothetical protein PBT89_07540 [Zunongwangia sp. HRR-M8]